MIEPDATMTRIGRGMELSQRGEGEAARGLFAEVWNDIGRGERRSLPPLRARPCNADVQDDVHEELAWDLRALEAADLIPVERAALAGYDESGGQLLPVVAPQPR